MTLPGASTVTVTLEAADGGTTVQLIHEGLTAAPDPLDELASAQAALAVVQRVLRGLKDPDLDAPTPCEDLTVAGLLDHLSGSVASICKALRVAVPARLTASPEVRIDDAAQDTLEAFRARGLEGRPDMGFAELPATLVANILKPGTAGPPLGRRARDPGPVLVRCRWHFCGSSAPSSGEATGS